MKSILKQLSPPFITKNYRKLFSAKRENGIDIKSNLVTWTGNYASWQEAKDHATGYDDKIILEKCKGALLKVKNGEFVYERDSVLFDEIQYSWPLLSALQQCALENKSKLHVLDFGGSLGSSYFQNKDFLKNLSNMSWHIVEQDNFVEEGRKYFEDDRLKFFYTIEESIEQYAPHVLVMSSVLQYLPNPYEFVESLMKYNFSYIIVDRTSFIDSPGDDLLTVQTVPESIYAASYPCWFFNEKKFVGKFLNQYRLIADFDSYADQVQKAEDGRLMYWKGFYFKNKD
ncbi:MAG: TIGR04325 family methyltransferase [Bacteroidota bacterium]|nr:TIGR04325 family methyltransferase [Bacteroidota bacterium]